MWSHQTIFLSPSPLPKMPPSKMTILPFVLLLLFTCSSSLSDLQILLNFKQSLKIPSNSLPFFSSWNSQNTPCSFSGITCNPQNSIEAINLSKKGISGTISFASLCSLPFLSNLTLSHNNLFGDVSQDIRNCTQLQILDLSFNKFNGEIPNLSPLSKLLSLKLNDNSFTGVFPWACLKNIPGLVYLSLGDNYFFDKSPFPEIVTTLPNLSLLYLSDCNIHGEIPGSIGNLTELYDLELADNFLHGEIPKEITKLKKLWQLELYNNSLAGKIPQGFGNLSNLTYFDASTNNLEGDLSELRFLSNLVSLQLFENGFTGNVPEEFGEFKYLVNFSLYSNYLTGNLPSKLGSWAEFNFIDVSTNFLTGPIPPDMCKQGKMLKLLMLENQFTGEIPATYENCSTLIRFRVNNNSLSGNVPSGIWGLPNLNILDLGSNNLEGPIDAKIGEAKFLNQLLIGSNNFSGAIPSEISNAINLVSVDLSKNQLSGQIPSSIGGLMNLSSLSLEYNNFSAEIPSSIGSCVFLSSINLADNQLSGQIPASLGRLETLNSLNASNNKLSGSIPASLASLKLSSLDLSHNELTGEIPFGLSINAYSDSFVGNPNLCSDSVDFLRPCSWSSKESSDKIRTILTCILTAFALLLFALGLFIYFRRYKPVKGSRIVSRYSWDMKSFRILAFDEREIVNSTTKENVIGKGGSGEVYRVGLGSGKIVAVKQIWHNRVVSETRKDSTAMLSKSSYSMKSKEFDAEVSTLSSIRHVNVVKLYCSITSEDSSLLVYEYLPNGSLWDRLHTAAGEKLGLDWETRYEVAVGAARGLEYLHHGCERPILHRDVKSSNILLDEFFKPRIADFGLAKILQSGMGKESCTHVIAGTHGYIAPEYAYTWKVNEKSDVYSFGVVLLELVTGRRPIEAEYGDNKDIVYWVSGRMTSKESVMELIDPTITSDSQKENALKVLKIGVLCTARLPAMRPTMRNVVQMLEDVASHHLIVQVDLKESINSAVKLEKVSSYKMKPSP